MRDNFDRDFYGKRSSFLPYIIVSLLSSLLGAVLVLGIVSEGGMLSFKETPKQVELDEKVERSPIIESKLPSLDVSPIVQIAENVGPTVVGITNMSETSFFSGHPAVEKGSGSGVLFNEEGYIVTNNHVVEGANQLVVSLANGKEVMGEVVGTDPKTDLAVLKIDPKEAGEFVIARFGDSSKVKVGELAVAIGNPLGIEFARSITAGIISALDRSLRIGEQTFTLLQTDAAINPGNSGGALVNAKGEVIGINSAKIVERSVEGLNFAIPINTAKPIIEDLIEHGRVIRPWMGIVFGGTTVNEQLAKEYKLPYNYGIVVTQVYPGGPADKAGMLDKDIIVKLGDTEIHTFSDLQNAIEKLSVGDVAKVTVVRDKEIKNIEDKIIKLEIKLDQMPAKP